MRREGAWGWSPAETSQARDEDIWKVTTDIFEHLDLTMPKTKLRHVSVSSTNKSPCLLKSFKVCVQLSSKRVWLIQTCRVKSLRSYLKRQSMKSFSDFLKKKKKREEQKCGALGKLPHFLHQQPHWTSINWTRMSQAHREVTVDRRRPINYVLGPSLQLLVKESNVH